MVQHHELDDTRFLLVNSFLQTAVFTASGLDSARAKDFLINLILDAVSLDFSCIS